MDELSFGQWLRRQRKSLGLTQKQLAERVNCATITVRKIEAEQRHPSVQIVKQLAQALNIPPKEHDGFLRFALGYSQFAPKDATELHPWLSSAVPSDTSQPPILISMSEGKPRFSPGGIYDLDTISKWFSTAGFRGNSNPGGVLPNKNGTAPNIPEGANLLLVIPIKMLDHAMLSMLQSLQDRIRMGETSRTPAMGLLNPKQTAEAIKL
ncbi:MAG TPA: helix-turn-helix transcriptional regulator [Anaerolineales bacterium]|nr:helix-turn-helix transcriptional regulator [Anaerolineales bacterium]